MATIPGPIPVGQEVELDWHPADVLAALKKRGLSLVKLSTDNGYHPTAAGKALKRPWPAMERIIADALGLPPETIWPSRYTAAQPARRHRSASNAES